jgi:hypothetical protein
MARLRIRYCSDGFEFALNHGRMRKIGRHYPGGVCLLLLGFDGTASTGPHRIAMRSLPLAVLAKLPCASYLGHHRPTSHF